jgi:flagellar biosynthesis GTPase FlhF
MTRIWTSFNMVVLMRRGGGQLLLVGRSGVGKKTATLLVSC